MHGKPAVVRRGFTASVMLFVLLLVLQGLGAIQWPWYAICLPLLIGPVILGVILLVAFVSFWVAAVTAILMRE